MIYIKTVKMTNKIFNVVMVCFFSLIRSSQFINIYMLDKKGCILLFSVTKDHNTALVIRKGSLIYFSI